MHPHLIVILLLGRVLAQQDAGVPVCAQNCVDGYINSGIFGCAVGDYACVCSNIHFLTDLSCCIAPQCDEAEQANALVYMEQLCTTAQVTSLTPAGACPSTIASTSKTTSLAPGSTCAVGETLCFGSCVDLLADYTNCGSCGTHCNPIVGPLLCEAGKCIDDTSSTSSSRLSSSQSSTAIIAPTSSSSSSSSSTSTLPPPANPQSGLSTGAKAGIAVGVIGVVLIAVGALFLFWRRRRGNSPSDNALPQDPDLPPSYIKPELPAHGTINPIYRKEVSTTGDDLELMGDTSPLAEKTISGKEPATQAATSPVAELQSPASETDQALEQSFSQTYPQDSHELEPAMEKQILMEELATSIGTHELSPGEISPSGQRTELATKANDHELDTVSNLVDQQARNVSGAEQTPSHSDRTPAVAELPPRQTFSQPFSGPIDPYIAKLSKVNDANMPQQLASSTSSIVPLASQSTSAGTTSRMDELHAKRDKIQQEKERLLKLQELDELEATVQKEILEEARRQRGEEG